MKKLRYSFQGLGKAVTAAVLGLLVFASCAKDDVDQEELALYAERYDSDGQKAAVDDKSTYWVSGDEIRINDAVYSIRVISPTEARVRRFTAGENTCYAAVYPAAVFKSHNNTNYTVTIPNTHQYKQDGDGHQIIDNLPMVAYYPGGDAPQGLSFKHLTAALAVYVTNNTSDRIALDRVSISNNMYQLSGDVTFDIAAAYRDPENPDAKFVLDPMQLENAVDGTVTIEFPYKSAELEPNETLVVQVPILPVGTTSSTFNVKVESRSEGSRVAFDKTTNSRDNSIGRGVIGYVAASLRINDEWEVTDGPLFEEENGHVGVDDDAFYKIQTPEEFLEMVEAVNEDWDYKGTTYRNTSYELTQSLDLGGATIEPICYYNDGGDENFFDGHNYTISHFNVNSENLEEDRNYCGLFGKSEGDNFTIKNLNVSDASFTVAYPEVYNSKNDFVKVGGIIASIENEGVKVENCNVNNLVINAPTDYPEDVKKRDNYIGGVVGYVNKSCTIENCHVGAVIVADNEAGSIIQQFGGIVSRIDAGSKISSTEAGSMLVEIRNCSYDQGSEPLVIGPGTANDDQHYMSYGGIVAVITECDNLKIVNCTVHHNLVVQRWPHYIGGLIGRKKSSFLTNIDLDEDVVVYGNIDNQTEYNWSINPYIGKNENKTVSTGSATCNNTLTAEPSSGGKPGFQKATQTLANL